MSIRVSLARHESDVWHQDGPEQPHPFSTSEPNKLPKYSSSMMMYRISVTYCLSSAMLHACDVLGGGVQRCIDHIGR